MIDAGAPAGAGGSIRVGDEAVLFGPGGPSALQAASAAETIPYALTSGLTARVPRVYVGHEASAAPIRADQLLEQTFAWMELLKTPVVLDSAALKMKLFLIPRDPKDSVVLRDFTLQSRFYPGKYALRVSDDGRTWNLRLTTGGLPPSPSRTNRAGGWSRWAVRMRHCRL